MIYYTKTHEWIEIFKQTARIGITDYAQEQLSDVVFVELPQCGKLVFPDDPLVVIESVKIAGEVKSPVNGTIVMINEQLREKPELVNQDPLGLGWLLSIKLEDEEGYDPKQWMDQTGYQNYLTQLTT